MRQFFYLVCKEYDEETIPLKIFLQEYEAMSYGRKEADKVVNEPIDIALYKQEIARKSTLKRVKTIC